MTKWSWDTEAGNLKTELVYQLIRNTWTSLNLSENGDKRRQPGFSFSSRTAWWNSLLCYRHNFLVHESQEWWEFDKKKPQRQFPDLTKNVERIQKMKNREAKKDDKGQPRGNASQVTHWRMRHRGEFCNVVLKCASFLQRRQPWHFHDTQ